MGVVHNDPIPIFQSVPYVGYGQYAQDHKGVSCQQIAQTVLSGSAANIDFTNIPATYAHLLLIVGGRSDTAATYTDLIIRFNADSAANYDWAYMLTASATPAGATSVGAASIVAGYFAAATAAANLGGWSTILVHNYVGTTWEKSLVSNWSIKWGTSAGNMGVGSSAGYWRSAATISQITVLASAGNLIAGTMATLWGMV